MAYSRAEYEEHLYVVYGLYSLGVVGGVISLFVIIVNIIADTRDMKKISYFILNVQVCNFIEFLAFTVFVVPLSVGNTVYYFGIIFVFTDIGIPVGIVIRNISAAFAIVALIIFVLVLHQSMLLLNSKMKVSDRTRKNLIIGFYVLVSVVLVVQLYFAITKYYAGITPDTSVYVTYSTNSTLALTLIPVLFCVFSIAVVYHSIINYRAHKTASPKTQKLRRDLLKALTFMLIFHLIGQSLTSAAIIFCSDCDQYFDPGYIRIIVQMKSPIIALCLLYFIRPFRTFVRKKIRIRANTAPITLFNVTIHPASSNQIM